MATLSTGREAAVAAFVARAASHPAPTHRPARVPQAPEADEAHPERRALIARGQLVRRESARSMTLRQRLIAADVLRPAR